MANRQRMTAIDIMAIIGIVVMSISLGGILYIIYLIYGAP